MGNPSRTTNPRAIKNAVHTTHGDFAPTHNDTGIPRFAARRTKRSDRGFLWNVIDRRGWTPLEAAKIRMVPTRRQTTSAG